VRVIGSGNSEFVAGDTDLRGVFVAQSIQGTSTVIAQADGDRYAFFRGTIALGPPPPPPAPATAPAQPKPADGKPEAKEDDLLRGLQEGNSIIQQQQGENLKNNFYQQNKAGVKAKDAF